MALHGSPGINNLSFLLLVFCQANRKTIGIQTKEECAEIYKMDRGCAGIGTEKGKSTNDFIYIRDRDGDVGRIKQRSLNYHCDNRRPHTCTRWRLFQRNKFQSYLNNSTQYSSANQIN